MGATVVILAGSGVGQRRKIISFTSDTVTVSQDFVVAVISLDAQVDKPFSDHLIIGGSTIGIVVTSGQKLLTDNHFEWGMVVQWFGTTLEGTGLSLDSSAKESDRRHC